MSGAPGKRPPPGATTWKWVALASLAWLLLAFPYFEQTRNANEIPRLVQAMAMVDGVTLSIDGPERRDIELGPDISRNAETGRLYPNKPPGTSLALTPAYVIARAMGGDELTLRAYTWLGRLFVGIVPTVLLGVVLYRRYAPSFGVPACAAAVALYVTGTTAASYAHLAYGHQLAACFLAVGVALLVDASEYARYDLAALGGLTAGCAVAVEYGAVFAALPIAWMLVVGFSRPAGGGVLIAALVGAAAPQAGLAVYHHVAFGSPWTTGYHTVINADFAAKHGQGILGLSWPTLDGLHRTLTAADGGLLWWTPLLLVALVGLGRAAQRVGAYRLEARMWLGLIVLYVLVASSLSFEGGWRIGPRYLVAVLPGTILGFASAIHWARERAMLQPFIVALAAYSITVNALAATLWPHMDLTNVHQPVAEVLLPLWGGELEPYGVPWALGMGATATLAVVSAVGAVLTLLALGWGWDARASVRVGPGLALGLGLVWATNLVPAHPRGTANLQYIQRVWEPRPGEVAPKSHRLPDEAGFRALIGPVDPIIPEAPRRRRRRSTP